jgi:hypothetical protein
MEVDRNTLIIKKIENAIPITGEFPSNEEAEQVVDLSIDTLTYFMGLRDYNTSLAFIQDSIKTVLKSRLAKLNDNLKQELLDRFDNKKYSPNPSPVNNKIKLEFESIDYDYYINYMPSQYDGLIRLGTSISLMLGNFEANVDSSSRVYSTFKYLRQVVKLPQELVKYANSSVDYFLYLLTSWMFEKIGDIQELPPKVFTEWDCSHIEYHKRYWNGFPGSLYGKMEHNVVEKADSLFRLWFTLALHMFTCSKYFELCQVKKDKNLITLPEIFFKSTIDKERLEIDEKIRVCWDISRNLKPIKEILDNDISEYGTKKYNNIDVQTLVFLADTMYNCKLFKLGNENGKLDGLRLLVEVLEEEGYTIPLDTFNQKYWMIIKLLGMWDINTNKLKENQSPMMALDQVLK